MGGRHSTPAGVTETSAANGNGVHHQNDNNDDHTCAPSCFFFGNEISTKLRQVTGRPSDPMGSPLPETPEFQRKRRVQVMDALRNSDESKMIFSSQYMGLEKEVALSSTTGESVRITNENEKPNIQSTIPQISDDIAQVYEGPDSESFLLEKYQMMEVLGVGSTSTVHRCACRSTGKEFACKVIDCALIDDRFQGMMSQFHVEIETLRQLQHPGIIRLYDVYITGDKILIVMELMEGGELFDYVVQKGTLTEEEASKIVLKVTSALVFMHSKNIVHRDLKPENLLLKNKPNANSGNSDADALDVKIIDFGLSKAMKEEPVASTFLGTRGYLAPEMLQRRDYTRAVDTWALGVIVFVLLCGCLPFDDDASAVPSDDLVRAKFVLRFPRWAKNLSASAKDLLSHLLDVNPLTRYTAEQALNHPWVRGVTARKDSLLASPGRIKKSPLLVGGINSRQRTPPVGRKYMPPLTTSDSPNTLIPGPPSVYVRQASL